MSHLAISKVVVAGGTGLLGPPTIKHLLNHGFQVSVLTRDPSSAKLPSGVEAIKADYTSPGTVGEALAGRNFDAIVDLIHRLAPEASLTVMQAAVNAGIPRVIPSYFGLSHARADLFSLPFLAIRRPVMTDIEEKAAKGLITYTVLNTGMFLDYVLDTNAFVNFSGGKTPLYDGGDVPISASTHDDIGRAIAIALSKPEATANKFLNMHTVVMTQNKVLGYARKAAPGAEFDIEPVDTKVLVDEAWERYNDGDRSYGTMIKFAVRGWVGMGCGLFESTDNELLGVKQWGDEGLSEEIARRLKEKPPTVSKEA